MSGPDHGRSGHPEADRIVAAARRWIGTPYRHQGSLRQAGCDCLGLVRGVWRELVGPEPETPGSYAPDWAEARGEEMLAAAGYRHFVAVSKSESSHGDIVLFRWRPEVPAKHVGILSGAGSMIHAHEGASVCEVPLSAWWARRIAFAFRFPSLCPPATQPIIEEH